MGTLLSNQFWYGIEPGQFTPLMRAAALGDPLLVQDLLAKNPDVNVRGPRGSTALMFAAGGGHFEIVKLLVANNADVFLKEDGGWSALDLARDSGFFEIWHFLSIQMTETRDYAIVDSIKNVLKN